MKRKKRKKKNNAVSNVKQQNNSLEQNNINANLHYHNNNITIGNTGIIEGSNLSVNDLERLNSIKLGGNKGTMVDWGTSYLDKDQENEKDRTTKATICTIAVCVCITIVGSVAKSPGWACSAFIALGAMFAPRYSRLRDNRSNNKGQLENKNNTPEEN